MTAHLIAQSATHIRLALKQYFWKLQPIQATKLQKNIDNYNYSATIYIHNLRDPIAEQEKDQMQNDAFLRQWIFASVSN